MAGKGKSVLSGTLSINPTDPAPEKTAAWQKERSEPISRSEE